MYWKPSSLFEERCGKLRAADQVLEGLVHVERRGDELPRAHGAAVGELDAGGLAVLDHDAVDGDLRLHSVPPAAMKVSISPRARLNEPPWQSW